MTLFLRSKRKISTLTIFTTLTLLVALSGCKKGIEVNNTSGVEIETATNYTTDSKYNLNVIYFIATDNPAIPDYERRISEALIQGQEYFRTWMIKQGYGDKTFGLKVDRKKLRVNIVTIKGKYGKEKYGEWPAIKAEIEAYYASHSAESGSDHYLVLQPEFVGVPYYGVGRWCFLSDNTGFDVKYLGVTGAAGARASSSIGGLYHELGHALNLAHNSQTVSQKADPGFGTALMNNGNHIYGMVGKPVFLTKSDCAALSHNQIFNKEGGIFYNGGTADITEIGAIVNNGIISLKGKFTTSVDVTDVGYFIDPYIADADGKEDGYDAVSFLSKPVGGDFAVEIPLIELFSKGNTPYNLKVKFYHKNGNITTVVYPFDFKNDVPVFNSFITPKEYNKSTWKVIGYSTFHSGDGNIEFAVDNNKATSWTSEWTTVGKGIHPHYLTVDMQAPLSINGVSLTVNGDYASKSKDVDIYTSIDNVAWTLAASVTLRITGGVNNIDLPAKVTARYLKIVVKSNWQGTDPANLAEIGAYLK